MDLERVSFYNCTISDDTGIDVSEFGLFHRADRSSPTFVPGVLILLVHGIQSDPESCWRTFPQRLLERLNAEIDILNYKYASKFLERASLETAAEGLGEILGGPLTVPYDTVILISHSTGGLVVKKAIVDMVRLPRSNSLPQRYKKLFAIVNIAVPHLGARPGLAEFLRKIVSGVQATLSVVGAVVRVATMARRDWGRNKLWIEIGCAPAKELDDAFVRSWKTLEQRPELLEIVGNRDIAASRATWAAEMPDPAMGATLRVINADHISIKFSASRYSYVLAPICEVISPNTWRMRYFAEAERSLRLATVSRVHDVDDRQGVTSLYGLGQSQGAIPLSARGESPGQSQAKVFDGLLERVISGSAFNRLTVVTGAAGCGKSVVLRHLARALYSESASASSEWPIVFIVPTWRMPISKINRDGGERGSDPHRTMMDVLTGWAELANLIIVDRRENDNNSRLVPVHECFLRFALMKSGRLVLILDGIDQLFNLSPRFASRIIDALPDISMEFSREDRGVAVIVGVRTGTVAEQLLGVSKLDRFEIGSIELPEAEKILPGVSRTIERLKGGDAAPAILLPIVFSSLARFGPDSLPRLKVLVDVFETAVEIQMDWNRLRDDKKLGEVLNEIGWSFFAQFAPLMNRQDLARVARTAHPDISVERLSSILELPVFLPIGGTQISFSHDLWLEFFAARYVATKLKAQKGAALALRALTAFQYRIVSQILDNGDGFSPELAELVLGESLDRREPYIWGNFAAIVGTSRSRSSLPAMATLLRSLEAHGELIRFTIITRFGDRSTDTADVDPIRAEVCDRLSHELVRYVGSGYDQITQSVAWCYRIALRQLGYGDAPKHPQPLLSAAKSDDVTEWLCSITPGGEKRLGEKHISLQLTLMGALKRPEAYRMITLSHYLFLLCVARAQGVAAPGATGCIAWCLDSDSSIRKLAESSDALPGVSEVFASCARSLHGY